MKKYLKKSLALLLTLLMAASAMTGIAAAEEPETDPVEEGEILDAVTKTDETNNDAVLESDQAVSAGFTMPDSQEDPKNDGPAVFASTTASGSYGSNVTWTLDSDGVLTISGTGEMENPSNYSSTPWYSYRNNVTRIVVSSGITSLCNYCFTYSAAASVSLPSSLVTIGSSVFAYCSNLTSVEIPDQVTTIGYGAFAICSSLADIKLGNSVKTIGDYAFQDTCATYLEIPASVTSISTLTFFSTNFESFSVSSGNSTYSATGGVLYTDSGKTLFAYPAGNSAVSFTVPSGVTKIGSEAFAYARNLTSISFPSSVTSFGESAFQNMYKLTTITIPDSVTEVGYFTFYSCPQLTTVTFGAGLQMTSYEMFEYCTALTTINFNAALEELNSRTFAYCSALESVTLPSTVKTIGNGCFGECRGLKTFISEGLSSIPFQAFLNDTSLVEVVLNEGVTTISREVFGGCSSLKEITLPASMEFVYFNTFPSTTTIINKNTELRSYRGTGYRYLEDVTVSGTYMYDMAYQVLDLVNQERAKVGASALVMDESLLDTAMQRSTEISALFSHTRPDGSDCFYLNSSMYAENVALGQRSAEDVMDSWMNSEGHKENILNTDYTTIGIGCFYINGTYYWAQSFGIGAQTGCAQPSNRDGSSTIALAVGSFQTPITTTGNYFGTVETFSYSYYLNFSSSVSIGTSATATMYVSSNQNLGYRTPIDSSGVTFSSSSTDVATVNSSGLVTGLKYGSANITASLAYSSATSTVNVSDPNYTGFEQSWLGWYYCVNGQIDTNCNSVIYGTVNGQDGWWYVVGGWVQLNYTGVANFANEYGWWYIKDGQVDFSKNSVEKNNYGWWYVVGGKVDFSYTGVGNYCNDYGWWYIRDGQVDFSKNSVEQNNYGWWYVLGGQVQFGYTGVANYANDFGWWYIRGGQVDFSRNSVEQNNYGWWYVTGGKVDFSYTGVANYANDYGWWYISGGKVDFSRTSVEQNNYGWWRVENGKVNFSFTGWAKNSYGTWYCVNGKVDFSRS